MMDNVERQNVMYETKLVLDERKLEFEVSQSAKQDERFERTKSISERR